MPFPRTAPTARTGAARTDADRPAGRSRRLGLPLGVAAVLGAGVVPVLVAPPAAAETLTVRSGDTLGALAARHGTTVRALVAANGLRSADVIRSGQRLTLPAPAAPTTAVPSASPTAAPASATTYTARSGDTLGHIAQRTGSTVAAIARASGIADPSRLRVGQVLTIPGAGAAAPAPTAGTAGTAPTAGTVVVRAGDTVSAIAARAGLPVASVLSANGLRSTSVIRPGQVLALPGGAAPAAPAPSAAPAPAPSAPVASTFAGRTYASGVTSAATTNRDALRARPVPSREEMKDLVATTAVAMGVDPALALAVAHQESGFDMRAVSPANAVGVMQVIPSSGRWASELVGRPLDLLDPRDNVVAGVAILASLRRSAADLPTAIAGYYQGLAGVRKNGMYPDTRRYVANVQTLMARF